MIIKPCDVIVRGTLLAVVATVGAVFGPANPALAQVGLPTDRGYVGPSFLQISDVAGNWRGADHKGWIRVDAHYWHVPPAAAARMGAGQQGGNVGAGGSLAIFMQYAVMQLPAAPRSGEGTLVLAFDKDSPALPALMKKCRSGAAIPEAHYAVSAERSSARPWGTLPADVPAQFEFKMSNVQFVDCPVVDRAPQQAIVVKFGNIEWLNWHGDEAKPLPLAMAPAALPPLPANLSGESRAWVVTWIGPAQDSTAEQCPVMNDKPTEADYYAQMSPEEATKERAALASQGGPSFQTGQMALRGPHRLNVVLLPGIVPDPGLAEPKTTVARGVNLDGRKSGHNKYVSEDGKQTGIDNKLYTVQGCIAGMQGHKAFGSQFVNSQMHDGQMAILIQVDGIDNMQNDKEVYVTTRYSVDPMAKSSSGGAILPNFTFRVSDMVQFTHVYSRVRGRIVDGAILTDAVPEYLLNLGVYSGTAVLHLQQSRMRLEITSDGGLKGVIGGYRDWRSMAAGGSEFYSGAQQPALYNSLRRNADGLRDPVTGEFDGISTAYDVEGVPAFVVDERPTTASTNGPLKKGRQ
jgi:hypothetical protein